MRLHLGAGAEGEGVWNEHRVESMAAGAHLMGVGKMMMKTAWENGGSAFPWDMHVDLSTMKSPPSA